jgi:hypothetical protein
MRNLRTSDIFAAVRLATTIGIREEIKEVAKQAEENKGNKVQFDYGFDLIFGLLEKATKETAEEEFYKFLANIFECTWEEVRDMDPVELLDGLEKVANIEKWKDFFERVARLMKKK